MTGSFDASPDASVIVPTYGDWDALQGCLDCLAGQTLDAARFEIVIADNNAEPAGTLSGAPAAVTLPCNASVVHQSKSGSYAARNAALARARGAVLFFTDADCRPEPDWLSAGLARLAADPDLDRIGGLVVLCAAAGHWSVPELHDRLFNLRQDRYVRRGYAATANLIVRRGVFDAVGPFDESLRSSGDKEWNRRAGAAGASLVLAEEVRVRHPARNGFAEHARKRARVVQGRRTLRLARGRRSPLPALKYLFPSPSAVARIVAAPSLSPGQRLGLLGFDYRLRLHELRVTFGLAFGDGRTYR